jgi:hypothetical protein
MTMWLEKVSWVDDAGVVVEVVEVVVVDAKVVEAKVVEAEDEAVDEEEEAEVVLLVAVVGVESGRLLACTSLVVVFG